MEAIHESFEKTQLGLLLQDPVMKPFAKDLGNQLRDRLGDTQFQLGLKWEDLEGIYGGEACFARVQPGGVKAEHASVMLVDVTGKAEEVKKVRAAITKNLHRQKATESQVDINGQEVVVYNLPRNVKLGLLKQREIMTFVLNDQLVVTNHLQVATQLIQRMKGANVGNTLNQFANFNRVMSTLDQDADGLAPQVRWYVDPFRFAEVIRAARSTRTKRRGRDLIQILGNQGFDAVQAAGGYVNLATENHEALHRSFVLAPPVLPGAVKFNKAARMLNFPARKQLPIEPWIPRNVSNYVSLNWSIPAAFEASIGLIDEIVDSPGFVQDVLKSFSDDKNGPQIDLRAALLNHLDDQIISFADHTQPVDTKSERVLVAIRITDEVAVTAALQQLWNNDPQAKKQEIAGKVVWEIVPEEDEIPQLNIPGALPIPGGGGGGGDELDGEVKLPNAAMTVSSFGGPNAYLLVATNIGLLDDVLKDRPAHASLGKSADFLVVNKLLESLGAGEDCFRLFSRTDEQMQMAYEMIRKGKMPQAESLLGKALNALMGSDDAGVARKPQLDGKNLPGYEVVRRYLGPAGAFVKPRQDGWMITGILVSKQKLVGKGVEVGANLTYSTATGNE